MRSVQPYKILETFTFVYRKWMLKVSRLLILFLTLSNDYVVREKKHFKKIMKKKFFKATLAVAAIAVVCKKKKKTYQSYFNSNQKETENVLLAENVLSYSDEGLIKRVCQKIAGICIEIIGAFVGEDEPKPEPKHYTLSNRTCILGRDSNGNAKAGNQEFCLEQNGPGVNSCTPGWVGPCI